MTELCDYVLKHTTGAGCRVWVSISSHGRSAIAIWVSSIGGVQDLVAASLSDNDVVSVSESIPASIKGLWQQAAEHAEVVEDDLHLLPCVGNPFTDSPPSVHLQPGVDLSDYSLLNMFNEEAVHEANDRNNLHKHRIGLRCHSGYDTPLGAVIALGLLRHEIEHAIQYSGSNAQQLYNLDCIADDVAKVKDGPLGNRYYCLKPTELGANTAAASLVLGNVTADVEAQLRTGKFAPFVTSQTTVPVADLPRLTVRYIHEHGSWEELVESTYPGASAWWRELVDRAHDDGRLDLATAARDN